MYDELRHTFISTSSQSKLILDYALLNFSFGCLQLNNFLICFSVTFVKALVAIQQLSLIFVEIILLPQLGLLFR